VSNKSLIRARSSHYYQMQATSVCLLKKVCPRTSYIPTIRRYQGCKSHLTHRLGSLPLRRPLPYLKYWRAWWQTTRSCIN